MPNKHSNRHIRVSVSRSVNIGDHGKDAWIKIELGYGGSISDRASISDLKEEFDEYYTFLDEIITETILGEMTKS